MTQTNTEDNSNVYEELSRERKELQEAGHLPDFFTTGSWQVFKEKYLHDAIGFKDQIERIVKDLARFAPPFLQQNHKYYDRIVSNYGNNWEEIFFSAIWKGHLVCSSPVLANGGTELGSPVSCSGSAVEDSVSGFFEARTEAAVLTKEGFGTSAYLGDIRPRGVMTSKGFPASGSWPVFEGFTQDAQDVSQGATRRGAWAGYLPIDHGDFDEWCDNLRKNPIHKNVGWVFTDEFIKRLESGDEEADRRYKKMLVTKALTGKGYIWKVDAVNRQQPAMYEALNLTNKASNLCTEITLFADKEHSFSCILSSQNLKYYDETKDAGLVFIATVFLDCVTSAFIERAKGIKHLEKVVRSTIKGRAIGLGALGFHSYLQSKMIPIENMEAHLLNTEIFKRMNDESLEASQWLAQVLGEPEWCKGFGVRHTHRTAIAPNFSSATMAGQVSQGIEPWFANVFYQPSAGGELQRINPEFLALAKARGKYNSELIKEVNEKNGSVQHLDWLTEHERQVFKTAFEIDQKVLIRMLSVRQRYICQGQSFNLFIDSNEDEEYISELHAMILRDKFIKGSYYLRTLSGVKASKDECKACEG